MTAARPTLLLTRPLVQSQRFAEVCRARLGEDVAVVISPLLEIAYRDVAVDLVDVGAVVATSAHGIAALARLVDVSGRAAYCVGDATAAAARRAGMRAVSAAGDAGDLVALIRAQVPAGALLYVRGEIVSGDVEGALVASGCAVRSVVLYDQLPVALSSEARALLQDNLRVIVPLFSARSAEIAGRAMAKARARIVLVAISAVVADAWTGPGAVLTVISGKPDADSILGAIYGIYNAESA